MAPTVLAPSSLRRCVFLRSFSDLDRDARFHFLSQRFLDLEDMAQLNSTSRDTREWMKPGAGLRMRYPMFLWLTPKKLQQIARCSWIRTLVGVMQIDLRPTDSLVILGSRPLAPLAQVAAGLRSFSSMRRLHLKLGSGDATRDEVRQLFDAVPRLTHLKVTIVPMDTAAADARPLDAAAAHAAGVPFTPGLMAHCFVELDRLSCLTSLEAYRIDEPTVQFNFALLPSLPLRQLILSAAPKVFWLQLQQARLLAQCHLLSVLNCGQWCLPGGATLLQQEQFSEQTIGFLVESRLAALAAWERADHARRAHPSFSSSAVEPPPTAVPLTIIDMRSTGMTRTAYALSKLKSLRSITPKRWNVDLTPEQWSRLADFRDCLEEINVFCVMRLAGEFRVDVDSFLPALLQCTRLRAVGVGGVRLSSLQMASLCSLPELRHFQLLFSVIAQAGMAALTGARKLSVLVLQCCEIEDEVQASGPGAPAVPQAVRVRTSIPALQVLVKLAILDHPRAVAAVVLEANAALRARLPSQSSVKLSRPSSSRRGSGGTCDASWGAAGITTQQGRDGRRARGSHNTSYAGMRDRERTRHEKHRRTAPTFLSSPLVDATHFVSKQSNSALVNVLLVHPLLHFLAIAGHLQPGTIALDLFTCCGAAAMVDAASTDNTGSCGPAAQLGHPASSSLVDEARWSGGRASSDGSSGRDRGCFCCSCPCPCSSCGRIIDVPCLRFRLLCFRCRSLWLRCLRRPARQRRLHRLEASLHRRPVIKG